MATVATIMHIRYMRTIMSTIIMVKRELDMVIKFTTISRNSYIWEVMGT
jgi:hypothetical protein